MDDNLKEYAWSLYSDQGLNWKQIKFHLTEENNVSELKAREIIDELRENASEIEKQNQEDEKIKEINDELYEITRDDKSQSPMERADNKLLLGVTLLAVGIISRIILYNLGISFIRFSTLLGVFGIGLIITGIRNRKIVTKYNNKKK